MNPAQREIVVRALLVVAAACAAWVVLAFGSQVLRYLPVGMPSIERTLRGEPQEERLTFSLRHGIHALDREHGIFAIAVVLRRTWERVMPRWRSAGVVGHAERQGN